MCTYRVKISLVFCEVAPVANFPLKKKLSVNEKEAFQYYFVQPSEYGKSNSKNGYLVFGLASLCNHADKPNSRVDWIENKIGLWSHLIALKEIKAGEEVTLFYTNIDKYVYAENFV